jgi:hypothetical protein
LTPLRDHNPSSSFRATQLSGSARVDYAATKCSPANVHTGVIKSFVRAAHSAAGGRQRVRRAAHPRRAAHTDNTYMGAPTDGKRAGLSIVREPPNLVATEGITT